MGAHLAEKPCERLKLTGPAAGRTVVRDEKPEAIMGA